MYERADRRVEAPGGRPLHLKSFQLVPNAGDRLAPLIVERFFGRPPLIAAGGEELKEPNLILLGSILQWADARSHVCGAGLISTAVRPAASPRAIHCVRGPLTARRLEECGIACPDAYGDPGILAPEIFPPGAAPDLPIGLVPHYADRDDPCVAGWRALGLPIIDVGLPLAEFFQQLQRCGVILSSSLHGLVFAHAYGRRALWVELSTRVIGDGFKFFDYYESAGIPATEVARYRPRDASDLLAAGPRAGLVDHRPLRRSLQAAIAAARRELLEG